MVETQGRCPLHQDVPHTVMADVEDRFWGHDGTFAYARCTTCGTMALDPRPAPDALGPYYADYYPADRLERAGRAIRAGKFKSMRHRRLKVVARMGGDVIGPVSDLDVLDVGCGLAHFLGALKEAGAKSVRGVDFGQNCADFARDVYGIDVDPGELEQQGYQDGQFNLVTAWHYLEHVYEPDEILAELFRITRPGGCCFVEVPARTPIAWLMGRYWVPLQAPAHLWHFSEDTLRRLFEQAGFEVVRTQRGMQLGEFACSFVMLFTKGLMPKVARKPLSWRALLLAAIALLELPFTMVMTLAGYGGLQRLLARRPNEPAAKRE